MEVLIRGNEDRVVWARHYN